MRRRSLALALLAALAVAGCGGGDDGGDGQATKEKPARDVVAAAAATTSAAGTSKIEFTAKIEPPPAVSEKTLEFGGAGAFDYESRRGRLSYDLSGLLEAAGQEAPNATAEIVFDGFVLYMKFPLLTQSLPGGKPWVKLDLEGLSKQRGFNVGQLSELTQSDPTQALDWLKATSADVKEVGSEQVRGVEATHYRMSVDLEKVADQAPADQREQIRKAMRRMIEQTGTSTIPTEAWIDEDGRVRRQRFELGFAVPGGASGNEQKAKMTMTMDLYDFGTKVDAEPPPANQVTDLADVIENQRT